MTPNAGPVCTLSSNHDMAACISSVGQDKLFRIVYERNKVKKKGLDPHLWSYRQRVSLEHLGLTLLDVKLKEKYPILHEFLRVVS